MQVLRLTQTSFCTSMMKTQSFLFTLYCCLLGLLVTCNAFTGHDTKTSPSISHNELSFGVEFTLDNIISSVTLANGSTYGLAKVPGGPAYQSLMRQYLNLAHHVYLTQKPTPEYKPLERAEVILEEDRRNRFIRNPDSWWDFLAIRVLKRPKFSPEVFEGDEYAGNIEVDILASAVEVSKLKTFLELHHQFNISSDAFRWPYASIVTPDFLWTTIKPQPDAEIQLDGLVSWNANFDHESIWFHDILRKLCTALYRNKFRRVESTGWQEILSSTKMLLGTSPTSVENLSHARQNYCMHSKEGSSLRESECEERLLSSSSINVDFNNATLTLWLEQSQRTWTPFNTFTELGGHALARHSGDMAAKVTHWDRVIENLYFLAAGTETPVDTLDLILSGDAWTADRVTAFKDRLKTSKTAETISVKNVILQPDIFASSKRSAEIGNHAVNTRTECSIGVTGADKLTHDEV